MKENTLTKPYSNAKEEVENLLSLTPIEAGKQLLKMYFRFYEVNKLTAFSNFYYRMMTVEDHLANIEKLDDLLIELTQRYKKQMFWCFTTKSKLELQNSLIAHIK
tara:strand:+ start:152 stop:466 length:315 start_codon:yes stop_codon:yes gene_type:complete